VRVRTELCYAVYGLPAVDHVGERGPSAGIDHPVRNLVTAGSCRGSLSANVWCGLLVRQWAVDASTHRFERNPHAASPGHRHRLSRRPGGRALPTFASALVADADRLGRRLPQPRLLAGGERVPDSGDVRRAPAASTSMLTGGDLRRIDVPGLCWPDRLSPITATPWHRGRTSGCRRPFRSELHL
jgi:hypothetical protein